MVGVLDRAIRHEIELHENIGSQTLAKTKCTGEELKQ